MSNTEDTDKRDSENSEDGPLVTERGNVTVQGALDLTSGRPTKTLKKKRNGETVGGTTEDDLGDVRLDPFPEEVRDPDDLTDLQRDVILQAAMFRDRSLTAIADSLGCATGTVSNTLTKHWPERSPKKKATPEEIDEWRRRALDGETTRDIAEDADFERRYVGDAIKGHKDVDGTTVPPLEYDRDTRKWVIPDAEPSGLDVLFPDADADADADPDEDFGDAHASIRHEDEEAPMVPDVGGDSDEPEPGPSDLPALDALDDAIEHARKKASDMRFVDFPEDERVQIEWFRALTEAVQTRVELEQEQEDA